MLSLAHTDVIYLTPGGTPMQLQQHPVKPTSMISDGAQPAATVSRAALYGWLTLLLCGPMLLVILQLFPALDAPVFHDPTAHVLITAGASSVGTILALLALRAAYRSADGRVFLVGMGFLATASIFIIHAVATPDVLMIGRDLATGWSALFSLVLGGALFASSGLPLTVDANLRLMRHARTGVALYLIGLAAYAWLVLVALPALPIGGTVAYPAAGAAHPTDHLAGGGADLSNGSAVPPAVPGSAAGAAWLSSERLSLGVGMFGLACYGFATWQHLLIYRRWPSATGFAVLCGIVLLGEALLTQQAWTLYGASFWLSHAQEFVAFGVIGFALLGGYRRGQPSQQLLESLFLSGTRSRIQAEYVEALDSLIDTLAAGQHPSPSLRHMLTNRLGMSAAQLAVLERAARAVAQERRQRHELEELNVALHQLEQAKTQLTQMVVHDLKTPLTALIGFLEILRMSQLSEDQKLLLESALRSAKNLTGLIGDLLDVGRLEEGEIELERTWFLPGELLAECVAEVSAWLAQDGKTVRIELGDERPPLNADRRLVRRVVLNLLSNAIKHTPLGTRITLRAYSTPEACASGEEDEVHERASGARRGGDSLVLEVEDDGPGIAPENLDLIFQKFVHVRAAWESRHTSTGLGLTFCRLAVEAHGGSIQAVSAPGTGALFRIVLPLLPAPPTEAG